MKASELRIGNWVETEGGFYQIDSILNKDRILVKIEDEYVGYDINQIKPIPLTEEWLIKFGFDKRTNINDCNAYTSKIRADIDIIEYSYGFSADLEVEHLSVLKYVHQLQNLIHALTGEELTIKE